MFTGLIETVGVLRRATGSSPRRLTIASSIPAHEVAVGDSIAIDGCCLTVVEKPSDGLTFEAATETLRRTTLGALRPSSRVHLERALKLGARLDGHLVMGHVDGVGVVRLREQRDSALYLGIEAPADLAPLIASQGSVAVAGVSLTVSSVAGAVFEVAIIPHTLAATTLNDLARGAVVNLEADLIARYAQRLMSFGVSPQAGAKPTGRAGDWEGGGQAEPSDVQKPGLTRQFLEDKGFL